MLEYSDFSDLVGDRFTARSARGPDLDLELVDATERGEAERVAPGFTLVFQGEGDAAEQQTFEVSHPALGDHPIFLVPVGHRDGTTLYEAVFTRA